MGAMALSLLSRNEIIKELKMLNRLIRFFLENRLVTYLILIILIAWGIINSPFGWDTGILPSDPVPVDAIPDLGENQQIVYTEWPGRSPQDIEDQVSYPLTTSLLGIPGVKTVRSSSIFGLSSIYLIFNEDVEFYWSRTRILEKLNSLPPGTLPDDVNPSLGPDATALGQVFWYTLEGRDPEGNPSGGWDPHELRTIQDFYVKYALTSAGGVAEVGSIGGFVKEYQVDIDPAALRAFDVTLSQVIDAVRNSNLDVGARTIEINRAEYLVRSLGYIKSIDDLEESVVVLRDDVPVRIRDIARVSFGPATRRGGLDKNGAEAVGGVVVARYGSNPLETINNLKDKIAEIEPGLPSKRLSDGTVSKVTIVPFYDRTGLIKETLGTLEEALSLAILISVIVIIVLVLNLRASFLISILLPIGVLITFILMRRFGVDANIVALSGIAISIGVMIDVGVVFTENIIRHMEMPGNIGARGRKLLETIYTAVSEVSGAVVTALATTIVSFLPVFALQAAEGKLFRPLAFTKSFAILSALVIGMIFIPAIASLLFSIKFRRQGFLKVLYIFAATAGVILSVWSGNYMGLAITAFAATGLLSLTLLRGRDRLVKYINISLALGVAFIYLTKTWLPLGASNSLPVNFIFVMLMVGFVLGFLMVIVKFYPQILAWCLDNRLKFLSVPLLIIILGLTIFRGFDNLFGFMPGFIKNTSVYKGISSEFPGLGREFMPSLDEGSFLLMPTTMPHSGIEENLDVIRMLDRNINSIPEVETVVGKWGRVNSALDPAPISMFENVINYKPEYMLSEEGHRLRFKVNREGAFVLKNGDSYDYNRDQFRIIEKEELIPSSKGEYFRQWRKEIISPDDIWNEIIEKATIPGLTSAPKLQPIQTRMVMLQTGMRAPMGIKVYGPDLESIERLALELESQLKNVEGVQPMSVFADRMVGKPYIEIELDRRAIARYGLTVKALQSVIGSTVGGMQLTTTVEGRERFPIRLRYARDFRDNPGELERLMITTPSGKVVQLGELASIDYRRGPQMIRSENTFLVGYVIFDKKEGFAEVDVVDNARDYLKEEIASGNLAVPHGVSYQFTGNYENQVRATKRLLLVIPVSLVIIFLILYFQFRSVVSTSLIFTSILVALSGGFILIWFYGQPWFLNGSLAGIGLRDMFQVHTINMSVAVWVGFIALFGIATDDGVLITTYIRQLWAVRTPRNREEIRALILEAGSKRVRPAMITTATTIIALLPVLTSTGKGSDIMVPMAIPLFGGMAIEVLTMFVVPVLYSMWQERIVERK